MIVKLVLDHTRLAALHMVLGNKNNLYRDIHAAPACPYVHIIKSESVKGGQLAVPNYVVTLEVAESVRPEASNYHEVKTPLVKLAQVLAAVGLFPEEDNVPVPAK